MFFVKKTLIWPRALGGVYIRLQGGESDFLKKVTVRHVGGEGGSSENFSFQGHVIYERPLMLHPHYFLTKLKNVFLPR